MRRVSFDEFKKALRVFADDYAIVNHPELKHRAPWQKPNKDGVYSVTQVPVKMTELDFLAEIQGVEDLVITCMDKDVAHSTWQKIKENKGSKIVMLTWGGGVVQFGEERVWAHNTIARYFAELTRADLLPKLKTINADDHDHVCGVVKHWLGVSLPELLSEMAQRKVTPHSVEEDRVMEALIRDGAFVWVYEFKDEDVEVDSHLHATNRENKDKSQLVKVDLDPAGEQVNVATLKTIKNIMELHGKKK